MTTPKARKKQKSNKGRDNLPRGEGRDNLPRGEGRYNLPRGEGVVLSRFDKICLYCAGFVEEIRRTGCMTGSGSGCYQISPAGMREYRKLVEREFLPDAHDEEEMETAVSALYNCGVELDQLPGFLQFVCTPREGRERILASMSRLVEQKGCDNPPGGEEAQGE